MSPCLPAGLKLGETSSDRAIEQLSLPIFAGSGEQSGIKVSDVAMSARDTTVPQLNKGGGEEALAESPFILSEGLPAIPYKLVKTMAELLHDNMDMNCGRAQEGSGSQMSKPTPCTEVPDLLSWVTCFGMYASVICKKYPAKVREMWAYKTMIVREARRCGGKGWQAYDAMFR